MSRKPRVFIGSSIESLPIADAINANLDHSCEVTIWRSGTFRLSSNSIDSLVEKAAAVDFAIFIFSPDDLIVMREKEEKAVRDNVVFELGLFIGSIGKERCYIVKPRNVDLHLPTDLLGITPADYEPNRSDSNIESALNYACTLIKKEVERFKLKSVKTFNSNKPSVIEVNANLTDNDYRVLQELVTTFTERPGGLDLWEIKRGLDIDASKVDLASIKLVKLGYVQKENAIDNQGFEYYAYIITNDGIEVLLEKDKFTVASVDEDDNLPF